MNSGMFLIGLILLIVGVFGMIYTVGSDKPYYNLGLIGVVVGAVILIIGASVPSVTTETQTITKEVPIRKKTTVRSRSD